MGVPPPASMEEKARVRNAVSIPAVELLDFQPCMLDKLAVTREDFFLGIGKIEDKAVVIDGDIAVRKMMAVTLSIDHRMNDGAVAAAFLQVVTDALESPDTLAERQG